MGSVRVRGGTYTAYWDEYDADTGRRRQRTRAGFPTERDALVFLADNLLLKRAGYDALSDVHHIAINTHNPIKWRFVDLDTGDVWLWDPKNERFARDHTGTVTVDK
jgi:hypothetical protein